MFVIYFIVRWLAGISSSGLTFELELEFDFDFDFDIVAWFYSLGLLAHTYGRVDE